MNTDTCTVWKACIEIATGFVRHHKNTVSMKMRKKNRDYCTNNLKNTEVFKNHFSKLYNNHKGTKYDETILNEIDK